MKLGEGLIEFRALLPLALYGGWRPIERADYTHVQVALSHIAVAIGTGHSPIEHEFA